jgi:polysaccharide deacetylase 2 family uncharacterized protein YibQ
MAAKDVATLPDSDHVRIPLWRPRLAIATLLLPLPLLLLSTGAGAATTLTATTLLIAPEYRLPSLLDVPAIVPDRPKVRLAIVIDDVGYNLERAERILALPKELTLGMLPFAPHTLEIAGRAARSGRELILHQPMEPLTHADEEPGTLELDMTPERFDAELAASLARLPQVRGVNNHTGSLLTAHREPMERLMQEIARRGLYFLDSRTTPDSVAETTARDLAVPAIRRDVFLDHVQSDAFLAGEFERSLAIARRQGYAVIIAHPHEITLNFLEKHLARLPADVSLTTLGALLPRRTGASAVRRLPDPDRRALARLENPAFRSRSPGP